MRTPSWRTAAIAVVALSAILAGALKTAIDVMLSRDPPASHSATGAAPGSRLAGLPLFEVPSATQAGDTLTIFYSGDNGWSKVDKRVSAALADAGSPVVGVDALRYYMQERSGPEAAGDLAAIIDHYSRLWNKSRIVLVGYSFGADSLPEITARLPAATRARVRLVALIGPGQMAELVFRPTSWINVYGPGATSVPQALASLKGTPSVCIYGAQDPISACPSYPVGLTALAPVPGGHRYKGQYETIADIILRSAGMGRLGGGTRLVASN
jgi:type IV secretory pathway VirJ component